MKAVPGSCLSSTIERKSDMAALRRHQGYWLSQGGSHGLSNNMAAGRKKIALCRTPSHVAQMVAQDDATCQTRYEKR